MSVEVVVGKGSDGKLIKFSCPKDGQNHMFDDLGITVYMTDGLFHRVDGPAYISSSSSVWYQNGKMHRVDGPALSNASADYWYLNGKLHRDGDAAILWKNGDKDWYQNGINYNPNGPATLMSDGKEIWTDSKGIRLN